MRAQKMLRLKIVLCKMISVLYLKQNILLINFVRSIVNRV